MTATIATRTPARRGRPFRAILNPIDASTLPHAWSDHFPVPLKDIFPAGISGADTPGCARRAQQRKPPPTAGANESIDLPKRPGGNFTRQICSRLAKTALRSRAWNAANHGAAAGKGEALSARPEG